MPEVSFSSLSLILEVFLGFGSAGGEARRAEMATAWSSQVDTKEADLSPTAQRMQQQAREKTKQRNAEEERKADAESLNLLEVATAAKSLLAKVKDKESLEILLKWTSYIAKHGTNLNPPTRASFCLPANYFKGMNGSPLSFEPPFSTQEEVRDIYEEDADSELEDFLAINRALREKVAETPKRNSITALLEPERSSTTKPAGTAAEYSQYMKTQAQSVLDLMDKLNTKDLQEDFTRDLAEAMQSPIPSPTPSIKQLPRDGEGLDAVTAQDESDGYLADLSDEGEARSEDSNEDGEDEWVTEENENAAKAFAIPASDNNASDEEWEIV